ncbi:MAG: Mur ligase family protein, partial [Ferruginibacter sp.]
MLKDLLYKVAIRSVSGEMSLNINKVFTDSRNVVPGSCFIAVKGSISDGHVYIDEAVNKGARVIICENLSIEMRPGVTYVEVENSSYAAGIISHNFYGEPSRNLKLVGITGTNGKTTIATLLFKLFCSLGYKCGLISTVKNQVGNKILEATHTTPDALTLNKLLKQMKDEACTHVFMECSSHA